MEQEVIERENGKVEEEYAVHDASGLAAARQ